MIGPLFVFAEVQCWISSVVDLCRQRGYVETLAGRRRFVSKLGAGSTASERSQAERQAVNTTVQGSAADLFKSALANVQRALRDSTINAYMVMQLHDELILEVEESQLAEAAKTVEKQMKHCWQGFTVKLGVRLKAGLSWGDMANLDF